MSIFDGGERSEIVTREDAERRLAPILEILRQSIVRAWRRWEEFGEKERGLRRALTPTTRAGFVRDQAVAVLRRALDGVDGVRLAVERSLFTIIVDERISIRIKKLDDRLRARNIQTANQRCIDAQMFLPGLEADYTWVVLGYVLDASATEIAAIGVACPRDGCNEWAMELLPAGGVRHMSEGERIDIRKVGG